MIRQLQIKNLVKIQKLTKLKFIIIFLLKKKKIPEEKFISFWEGNGTSLILNSLSLTCSKSF